VIGDRRRPRGGVPGLRRPAPALGRQARAAGAKRSTGKIEL